MSFSHTLVTQQITDAMRSRGRASSTWVNQNIREIEETVHFAFSIAQRRIQAELEVWGAYGSAISYAKSFAWDVEHATNERFSKTYRDSVRQMAAEKARRLVKNLGAAEAQKLVNSILLKEDSPASYSVKRYANMGIPT